MVSGQIRNRVIATLTAVLASGVAVAGDPVDRYNVVWDTPSSNSSGSMPLGNGDIGVNAWVEEDGDLLFYISKTDAWDAYARLLKLGRIRVTIHPNPFAAGLPFRQELRLRDGEMVVEAGRSGESVSLHLWVDANLPVIRLEGTSEKPVHVRATLENWRRRERPLDQEGEMFGVDTFYQGEIAISYPDVVLAGRRNDVVWYHRNEKSLWETSLRHQGLAELLERQEDPLLNRTFGAILRGDGFVRHSDTALTTARPSRSFSLRIYPLTATTPTAEDWVRRAERSADACEANDGSRALRDHRRWWREFWDRSWIRITDSHPRLRAVPLETNDLPLRIGADSEGDNGFVGQMREVRVYSRALNADEVKRLSSGGKPPPGCVLVVGGQRIPGLATVKPIGDVKTGEGSIGFSGHGYLQAEDPSSLNLSEAVTLEAWVKPGALPAGGGRIIDKSKAGTQNGYLLDTYPGSSLRMITAYAVLTYDAKLPTDRWTHVVGVFDARKGEQCLYVNGEMVAVHRSEADEHEVVTRGYVLQRYVTACAGRGAYPIKFNGSIFTVDVQGKYDPDYRRWGGAYWFQNTRLPYWPLLASGDHEMMLPLFHMYRNALELARVRTKLYFGHDGACFPETMQFWGTYHNGEMGYGWDREGLGLWPPQNHYIGNYMSGGLELSAMMLDYYQFTEDDAFLRDTMLPLLTDIVRYFAEHYPTDENGKMRFHPAQALETWWDCVNPLPEVAGLRFVLQQALKLPEASVGADRRAYWSSVLAKLPPIPTRTEGGQPMLAPADSFARLSNVENPELYAIFPYRLYGVGKPEIELARRAMEHRRFKGYWGWQQDDTQMAFLGMTNDAKQYLVKRFGMKDEGSRFPAFWGPNFDWIPDQDHGGNGTMALQTMLMQWDDDRILLLPAWPAEWDVEFKLCAPKKTTVEGVYKGGKLLRLEVRPPERRKDVVLPPL